MGAKVLVLGVTGMLGSMVFDYLSKHSDFKVAGTGREKNSKFNHFDAGKFLKDPAEFKFIKKFDYIINCIGVIKPFCKDDDPAGVKNAILINAYFPHRLADFCKNSKIIQIATDCVFSGKKGKYLENDPHDPLDVYGKTKSLGEVFTGNFLNIRCSIIGPEKKSHISLLDWFLSQPEKSELNGFTHHKWNGVTTLQFAELSKIIIDKNKFNKLVKFSNTHHFLPNNSVNKYQLLKIFKKVFTKSIKIKKVNNIGSKVDRTLDTNFNMLNSLYNKSTITDALLQLKNYLGIK